MKIAKVVAIVAGALLLTACGEPSEGDLRAAFEKQIAESNKMAQGLGVKMESKLHSLKKVGCKADGDNAYRCDVEVDMEVPLVGRKKVVAPVRFVKGSDGWVASK